MTRTDLCFLPATDLARLLRAREISAVELTQAHLERIDEVNPAVNALVTAVPDQALAQARAADAALASGQPLGPLHGLPVAHKDLTPTRGIRTTFGSPIFRDFVPAQDALLVERLRDAGAITLGKTNTPEFGAGSQTFNPIFGATRNPYNLARTCGGSSGGAAAGLASGMFPLADGTDLGGSLRNPASFCNVVGLRPSAGRVPNWPSLAHWFSMAVAGPMARTVADAALMLSAMAGWDSRVPLSLKEPGAVFAAPLEREFRGVRVAWSPSLGGLPMQAGIGDVLTTGRRALEDLGLVVEDADPDLREADEAFSVLRAWNMELSLGETLAAHRGQMKDTLIWNIEQGQALSGHDVGRAERLRTVLFERLHGFMQQYEFIACPVVQVLPFDVNLPYVTEIAGQPMETYLDWMKSCYHISVTGHPALSVPCGFTADGLPVGLQLVGRFRDDLGVLQLGHAFEQATRHWVRRPALGMGVSA